MQQGYYRYPTLSGDTIVFTCEDDLWSVSAAGGAPRRLTAGVGEASQPLLSPDGRWIAYISQEEGHTEVYLMAAEGGPARRLTYTGAYCYTAAWRPDGEAIIFASTHQQAFSRQPALFAIAREGGEPVPMPWGPARSIAYGSGDRVVVGRNTSDAARWKRYKGGTTGELWIDRKGDRQFERFPVHVGNPTSPMWVGDRIYFLADHEGYGNLYSCAEDGTDMRRHTDHEDYYARQASTDGRRIVYHAGADLYLYDPATGETRKVAVDWHAPSPQAARKFADAARYLDGHALHPKGHSLALTTRGKLFTMGSFGGAVVQLGEFQAVRYRLPGYLPDGERIVAVTDEAGEEGLAVFKTDGTDRGNVIGAHQLGRVLELAVSPTEDRVAIANHRHELFLVDLKAESVTLIERSAHGRLAGLAWSPDGAWLAYGFPNGQRSCCIKLLEVASGQTHPVTDPVLMDFHPSFDPKGDVLYFLSHRDFDPVYDNMHFDLGFPKGVRPCLVTLRRDVPSPFVPKVDLTPPEPAKDEKAEEKADKPAVKPVTIDLEGITRRVVPFPVPEGRYWQVVGLENKVLFTSVQPRGALRDDFFTSAVPAEARLEVYDFALQKTEVLQDGMTTIEVSADHKTMLMRVSNRFRVLPAGEKPKPDAPQEPGRESGWLDLGRVRVSIEPRSEWRQMYREAWRLQRDQFWTEDMSKVDWQKVHDAYLPLLARVGTRSEFSDLLWEMQGELGTSHTYEIGGDYRPVPRYDQGHLGASLVWSSDAGGYLITHIVAGEPGEPDKDSPLNRVGVDVRVGDVLLAINGQPLSQRFSPSQALVHQARVEVQLTLKGRDGGANRVVNVKTLAAEGAARYREWQETCRKLVHERSNGRLGYVHIPDMGAWGYSEFHRLYLQESLKDGLVVDVRNNGGGHVSQLILEKLGRRRLGYDVERWGGKKEYPDLSMEGPMVALTNEMAGSDGDIFSHCFKLMKLGPLLGKRTWGGVIGIWPRHGLADGSITTQPEFSFWFKDVGWGVENYGTDPDIEVDNRPQDYAAGHDAMLEKAIAVALEALEKNPPPQPDLSVRPNLAPPPLPARR